MDKAEIFFLVVAIIILAPWVIFVLAIGWGLVFSLIGVMI